MPSKKERQPTLVVINDSGALVPVKSKEELRDEMTVALEKISKKLKKLTGADSSQYKTNGSFKWIDTEGVAISLHSVADLQILIKALARVTQVRNDYEAAARVLQATTYPVCMYSGFNVEFWIHDIKLRYTLVTNAFQTAELQAAKARLENFLTEEDRLTKTLEDVGSLLK